MSNRWVISWLVIDYWRWSMSNRWVIEAQTFCGLSITHRWHRLLIDVIDYSSMIHRSLIKYYNAHERHFSCFLVSFFLFVILLSVLDAVFLVSEGPEDPALQEWGNNLLHQTQKREESEIFAFAKNGPWGLVQRQQASIARSYWRICKIE